MTPIAMPRLLPTTMACMAILVTLKCGQLLHTVIFQGPRLDPLRIATASAADPAAAKPSAHPVAGGAPPSLPAPAKSPGAKLESNAKPPDAKAEAEPASHAEAAAAPISESEKAQIGRAHV